MPTCYKATHCSTTGSYYYYLFFFFRWTVDFPKKLLSFTGPFYFLNVGRMVKTLFVLNSLLRTDYMWKGGTVEFPEEIQLWSWNLFRRSRLCTRTEPYCSLLIWMVVDWWIVHYASCHNGYQVKTEHCCCISDQFAAQRYEKFSKLMTMWNNVLLDFYGQLH